LKNLALLQPALADACLKRQLARDCQAFTETTRELFFRILLRLLYGSGLMSWAKDLFGISSDDEEGDQGHCRIAPRHIHTAVLWPTGV
jgi:hypothetical protein